MLNLMQFLQLQFVLQLTIHNTETSSNRSGSLIALIHNQGLLICGHNHFYKII